MIFYDRFEAAKLLAHRLKHYSHDPHAVILTIPRGGLQTGYSLAKELKLPLDIILIKKIGHPANAEYAIGAVSLTGEIISPDAIQSGDVPQGYIRNKILQLRETLRERHEKYYLGRQPLSLKNKTIIITDDGVATGNTLFAAIDLLKTSEPKKIVVAIPVGPPSTINLLKSRVDEVICLQVEENFAAVGQFYENFPQVEDAEAIQLLQLADKEFQQYLKKDKSSRPAA
ncbi:MAG: Phosphoribosyltransferase [uncultured bacterium]|nr:MAG: Phosphoribosyltransferase [uncultured bacterium]